MIRRLDHLHQTVMPEKSYQPRSGSVSHFKSIRTSKSGINDHLESPSRLWVSEMGLHPKLLSIVTRAAS